MTIKAPIAIMEKLEMMTPRDLKKAKKTGDVALSNEEWLAKQRVETKRRPPASVVAGAVAVLRGWRNDGADGESAHLVCDELEQEQAVNRKLRELVAEAQNRAFEMTALHEEDGGPWAQLHEALVMRMRGIDK